MTVLHPRRSTDALLPPPAASPPYTSCLQLCSPVQQAVSVSWVHYQPGKTPDKAEEGEDRERTSNPPLHLFSSLATSSLSDLVKPTYFSANRGQLKSRPLFCLRLDLGKVLRRVEDHFQTTGFKSWGQLVKREVSTTMAVVATSYGVVLYVRQLLISGTVLRVFVEAAAKTQGAPLTEEERFQ